MTQEEKRVWMIKRLMDEDDEYRNYKIPTDNKEQKDMFRALMNVRMPNPIGQDFLKIQDEYLTGELENANIVDAAALPAVSSDDRIALWQGDITTLKIDAIVNAANSQMCGCFAPLHNCIDNIIHTKSGIQLRLKCNEIMQRQGYEEPTGRAKITPAYNLPCKYVIHTVGPIVSGRLTQEHCDLLKSSYRSCLKLADDTGVTSIAFCCVSTGVFMFPNDRAAEIAVETVKKTLSDCKNVNRVVFNVFKDIDYEIYNRLLEN
jgi:O-acetyl-ADP-ribose deacetylase (regulator of RNase III)